MVNPMVNDLVRFAGSVQAAIGAKRGRKPVFNANMFYPHIQERELQSAVRNEFERFISEALALATIGPSFVDDIEELMNLEPNVPGYFKTEISRISRAIESKALSNFANQSEMIIGKPYYPSGVKEDILTTWQSNFQMLCQSAESDVKKDISQLVIQAKNEGWNKLQLENAVKKKLPEKYKSRAELIARTETAKLNTQINLEVYKDIGIEYYVWMTTMDGRERYTHAMMNGKICSVDNPDVFYEENPDDPLHPIKMERTNEMVHLHPGDDFQCRCSMVAWDPQINGKYDVKQGTVNPEEKPMTQREVIAEQKKEIASVQNKLEILQKAQIRHARVSPEQRIAAGERRQERLERSEKFSEVIEFCKKNSVEFKEPRKLSKKLSSDEIISRISGGDMTRGSCSSLALAYAANRAGIDVLDFRGGSSLGVFSRTEYIEKMTETGGFVTKGYNGYKVAEESFTHVEAGKEYYFTSGSHAAIIRKKDDVIEFLELQSKYAERNVFNPLTKETLKKRFGTKARRSFRGEKIEFKEFLIDVEKIKDSPLFRKVLGYINTAEGAQKKGSLGSIK